LPGGCIRPGNKIPLVLAGPLYEAQDPERHLAHGPDDAAENQNGKKEGNPKQESDYWEDQHGPF
jgi:hypothetical protein